MVFPVAYLVLLVPLYYLYKYITSVKGHGKDSALVLAKIEPVDPNFNWATTEPLKIRPFANKKDFRPNMGIKNLVSTPEEWLLMEKTYQEIITKKSELCRNHPDKIIQVAKNPRAQAAAREVYDTITNFMVSRYPQYFSRKGSEIYNHVTKELIPGTLKGHDPFDLYMTLSRTVEEDVVVLLKDDPSDENLEYRSSSAITGFPAGFDPSLHHNQVISEIHEVVPQYQSRLRLSMGRFFNRLQPKDLWVRHNWSIQTHDKHFNLNLNHGRIGQQIEALKYEDIDFKNGCFLRCERQVLTRLPKLRAIIMTIRTYLTPIEKIKEEGLADQLIFGIDSLPEDLAYYKKRPAWGEAVKQYLRE